MGFLGYGITTVSLMIPLAAPGGGVGRRHPHARRVRQRAARAARARPRGQGHGSQEPARDPAHLVHHAASASSPWRGTRCRRWPSSASPAPSASPINFVLTILVVPSVLQWLPPPKAMARSRRRSTCAGLRRFVLRMLDRRRLVIAVIAGTVLAACIAGIFLMEVDTDYLRFFPEDSKIQTSVPRREREPGRRDAADGGGRHPSPRRRQGSRRCWRTSPSCPTS